MRLLLIEDDIPLGNGIQNGLKQANYAVDWVTDGEAGQHALKFEEYEALSVDLTLPKIDGFQILKNVRKQGNQIPVLILTARDSISDNIRGAASVVNRSSMVPRQSG